MQPTLVVVLDNEASTVKAGIIAPGGHEEPLTEASIVTNAIVRQTKGEKKIFFDWDVRKTIWDELLYAKDGRRINTSETSLFNTEPFFNLLNIQDQYDQFVFKLKGFHSYYRCRPTSLLPYGTLFSSEASGRSRMQDDRRFRI
ncbi:ARP6_2 [Sanghuangporus sanghuang]